MHLLGFHDIFTTKTSVTRVRAVPHYSFSINTLEGLNLVRPTIGIMPSGLPWALKLVGENRNPLRSSCSVSCHNRSNWRTNIGACPNINKPKRNLKTVEKYHQYIYAVPYSDHSCFTEIQEFIKLLQPNTMKGIVSSSPAYVDPLFYFGHLCIMNQPSCIYQKLEGREERKKLEAVQTKYTFGSSNFVEATRKRRSNTRRVLGVRVGRMGFLRRIRPGAKILEIDSNA